MFKMSKILRQMSRKSGLPPGSLTHIGEKKVEEIKISVINYDEKSYLETVDATIKECVEYKEKPGVTWINVVGIHDVETMEELSREFGLHLLILEDVMNTGQRTKSEEYDDNTLIIAKMLYYLGEEEKIIDEQISIIFGRGYIITFQESEEDVLGPIRSRIKKGAGMIRRMGADYLVYSIIDTIVDGYFSILEQIALKLEYIEEDLITNPQTEDLKAIHNLKAETTMVQKSIWPLRDILGRFEKGGSKYIDKSTLLFIRDVYDHVLQVIDTTQTFRDMLTGMIEIYMSSLSNKMNEVMKVLTIIATIFIPLSFITGVYGMNFRNMPEIAWRWGYAAIWGVIIISAVGMLLIFWRKKWL
jgi:magnesium transporter